MPGLTRADGLQRMFGFDIGDGVSVLELHGALFPATAQTTGSPADGLSAVHALAGGTSGAEPSVGVPTDGGASAAALERLRGLEDIWIVASPGLVVRPRPTTAPSSARCVARGAAPRVSHRRARHAAAPSCGGAREERGAIDSTRAAIYYPWVTVADPLSAPGRDGHRRRRLNLPPSGFICGIYARNDVEQRRRRRRRPTKSCAARSDSRAT